MTDTHSHAHAYVVGALTADETQEFEGHLADCAECSSEVFDMRAVTSVLSAAVAADPPPDLRDKVLAQIAQTAQLEPITLPAAARTASVSRLTPRADASAGSHKRVALSDSSDTVVPLRRRWATSLLAAAAVVAALGFGGWALQAQQDAVDSRDAAVAQRDTLTKVLSANDLRTASSSFVKTEQTGTVVMSQDRGVAMFVASDLEPLPDGQVYEAWTIDGDFEPAGTFTPEGSQSLLQLPSSVFDASSVAITIEPAGGSPAPTSGAIFTVNVP